MKNLFSIVKYGSLALYFFVERHLPEIKDAAAVIGNKAFLAFDFWATLIYELLDIAVLCLVVFVKWLVHTELVRELTRAISEIITTPAAELRSCVSNIRRWAESAWTFRQEVLYGF